MVAGRGLVGSHRGHLGGLGAPGRAGQARLWGIGWNCRDWAEGKAQGLGLMGAPGDPHIMLSPYRLSLCATRTREAARLLRAQLGPRWGWATAS